VVICTTFGLAWTIAAAPLVPPVVAADHLSPSWSPSNGDFLTSCREHVSELSKYA
jgi:hypothetical protein